VLDTPQGGGLRMASDTVSVEDLVARVQDDPRFETREARCAMLARLVERSWRLGEDVWGQLADGLCADLSLASLAAR
jgi:hypothetical protein